MNKIESTILKEYIYLWERLSTGGIRLLHMYGTMPVVSVPDKVDGEYITELAPYCFADKSIGEIEQTEIVIPDNMTSISGKYVEKIILPPSISKIGKSAFYNCRNLKSIEMYNQIVDVEGDAFMNCTNLHELSVNGSPKEKSCLKQILSQIPWLITVIWKSGQCDDEIIARATFFEYDQSYDEIGPAHIFKLNMSGEGFRARQSFNERIFLWKQYDGTFVEAIAQERKKDLLNMAFYRLIYPYELEQKAEKIYMKYVLEHKNMLVEIIIRKRNLRVLNDFLEIDKKHKCFTDGEKIIDNEFVGKMIAVAAENDWGEGSAILLKYKKQNITKSRAQRFEF